MIKQVIINIMPKSLAEKKLSADARQAVYNALTVEQKIARLDQAFGEGLGAKRERARLNKAEHKAKEAEVDGAFVVDKTTVIVAKTNKKPVVTGRQNKK